jgi:hypothetical protein
MRGGVAAAQVWVSAYRVATLFVLLSGLPLMLARPAEAYSVLAHQSTVDAAWDDLAVPLLRQRFPRASTDEVAAARAYAYGGSLIQDLGYYPFGSRTFTNLTHYVRSGDFVRALIRNARDVNEYAFALGALAHYASDNAGHPLAVNQAVPLVYPKMQARVGGSALYADSPKRHVMVEFAFDVLQVARGAYAAQALHDRIGFKVSERVLDAATQETYGLDLGDLFGSVDLAIGTFRRAISTTIPEMTRIAWREKRDEIEARTPGVDRGSFVFNLTGRQYDREFGTEYRKPGLLSRVLAFVIRIIPKVGPFRALAFEPLTPDAERLFTDSVRVAHARYRALLQELTKGNAALVNTDFDTGKPPRLGVNPLTDETYAELLDRLAGRESGAVPRPVRLHLAGYFRDLREASVAQDVRKKEARIIRQLASLNGATRDTH